jgi:hypothetical protein
MKIRLILFLPACLTGLALLFSGTPSRSQNAPITTAATVGNALPGQVAMPVTVTGFNNIGAVSLTLDYNYTGLQFQQGVPNPQLGNMIIGDNNLGNGYHRVVMSWYGNGTTLTSGSTLVTLYFNYISGMTPLTWYDNGPSCEYADGNYNILNDLPTSTYYINGYICGGVGDPGQIAGDNAVCQGDQSVAYSVSPVANATGYVWTVPNGAVIATGQNTNSITVDYPLLATSGNVTVHGTNPCGSGPVSQLSVSVNALPIANAGNDVSIPYGTSTTLYASSGGTGTFTYHWSPESLLVNPDVQNPQTVNLTATTTFTLLVTNVASLCQNSDQVTVFISGGPLSVNPIAIPSAICSGDSSQLYANPGGGSGNYAYTWTCMPPGNPPWSSNLANPKVSPDTSTTYNLSVSDGFNTANGSAFLTVHELPTATITGGDTLCGEGNTTPLNVDLTGTPPWSFVYSNGLDTYTVMNQMTTPYVIHASDAGTYTVLEVQDQTCTGLTFGSATVLVFPVPPVPVVTQLGSDLQSSSCCGNQWYKDGFPIPGANSQIYTPAATAHYFTMVTLNGCSSDTSNDIYFVMTGIAGRWDSHIRVSPNPAHGYLLFSTDDPEEGPAGIRITDLLGRTIKTFSIADLFPSSPVRLDLSEIPAGLCILEVYIGNRFLVKKIMITP